MKRIVICGSRDYENYEEARVFLEEVIGKERAEDTVILSGACRGADWIGEHYAEEKGFSVERFPPRWQIFGRGAAIRRNREMAERCDAVVAFWDGKSRGTASMIAFAEDLGKDVFIHRLP